MHPVFFLKIEMINYNLCIFFQINPFSKFSQYHIRGRSRKFQNGRGAPTLEKKSGSVWVDTTVRRPVSAQKINGAHPFFCKRKKKKRRVAHPLICLFIW